MPYELVADKIALLNPEQQGELVEFLDFLLFRQKSSPVWRVDYPLAEDAKSRRKPGGLTGEFSMASDFDAPLNEFSEYM